MRPGSCGAPLSAFAADVLGHFSGRGGLGDPQFLGDRHGGAAAAVGIPDDLAFIGVHPLCQGPLLGQQFRWGDRIAGVFHRQGPWCR